MAKSSKKKKKQQKSSSSLRKATEEKKAEQMPEPEHPETEEETLPDAADGAVAAPADADAVDDDDLKDEDAMDVDDKKEKEEPGDGENEEAGSDSDEDDEEDSPKQKQQQPPAMPFLDAFYHLSSDDVRDRSSAARALLVHCFPPLPPSSKGSGKVAKGGKGAKGKGKGGKDLESVVNLTDASYALQRLLNGLCSGRASSRQGFASALSSFLTLAHSREVLGMVCAAKEDDHIHFSSVGGNALMGSRLDEGSGEDEGDEANACVLVRKRLLAATSIDGDSKFGRKKGSEERDHVFGRLFGILAVVRSGTLLLGDKKKQEKDERYDDALRAAKGYALDLIDLHQHKKWMREPAAHGLMELITSLSTASSSEGDEADKKGGLEMEMAMEIVRDAIVPKLLLLPSDDNDDSSDDEDDDEGGRATDKSKKKLEKLLSRYQPEQLAVALHLQTHLLSGKNRRRQLPFPLDQPLLNPKSIDVLTDALRSTSAVVHPRVHVVWPAIWSNLNASASSAVAEAKKEGEKDDPFRDVLEALFRRVVVESLLGGDKGGPGGSAGGTTHERAALAMTIVVGFLSSSSGADGADDGLSVSPDVLESFVLQPIIVEKLFLNVLCASGGVRGKGKAKKKGGKADGGPSHLLRSRAVQVLEDIVDRSCSGNGGNSVDQRLAILRAILRVEPRFDGRTGTATVSTLLDMSSAEENGTSADEEDDRTTKEAQKKLFDGCRSFLEEGVLSSKNSHEAAGYLDLMCDLAKRDLRSRARAGGDEESAVVSRTVADVLGFLLAGAYFDLSKLSSLMEESMIDASASKKKKKKVKDKVIPSKQSPAVAAGHRVKTILDEREGPHVVPHSSRVVMSARFFSLLSDCISIATTLPRTKRSNDRDVPASPAKKISKAETCLRILSDVKGDWDAMHENGAVMLATVDDNDEGADEHGASSDAMKASRDLTSAVLVMADNLTSEAADGGAEALARSKCASGCAALATALSLQLLRCGSPEKNDGDDVDMDENDDDDDDDCEAIQEMISDLEEIAKGLVGVVGSEPKVDEDDKSEEEEENKPLVALSDLCVSILSSAIGGSESGRNSTSRGAASKLTRETTRMAWSGGLSVAAAAASSEDAKHLVDKDVVNVLLDAVCGAGRTSDHDVEMDDMNSSEGGDQSDDDEQGVFVAANSADLNLDDAKDGDDSSSESDGMEDANAPQNKTIEGSDKEDVELDPSQLENLLLEDSDADISEKEEGQLEHHAGADAALAQLIKMKQEARKAGQSERERVELSNRQRCTMLLEEIFKSCKSHGSYVSNDVVFASLVPLLRERRALGKSIHGAALVASDSRKHSCLNEKKVLLDRISSLLRDTICKYKPVPASASETNDEEAGAVSLAKDLLNETRRSINATHCSCCSAALVLSVRVIARSQRSQEAATIYKEAVEEWSSKKNSRINACLFDDLIVKLPSIAASLLASPLSVSAKEAHSAYIKSESFRLLSALYASVTGKKSPAGLTSPESTSQENDSAIDALKEASCDVAKAIEVAIQDGDLIKAKRVRDVLKACEQLVLFGSKYCKEEKALWDAMGKLSSQFLSLSETSQSAGVKQICVKLSHDTARSLEERKVAAEVPEADTQPSPTASKKKKKKSKKKKK